MKLLCHVLVKSLFLPLLIFSQQESINPLNNESISIQLTSYDHQDSIGFFIDPSGKIIDMDIHPNKLMKGE